MSRRLASLLTGDGEASIADAESAADARLDALGDPRGWGDDDPRALLAFLLRMAKHELRFDASRSPRAHRDSLEARLARRPRERTDHAQLFVDVDSVLWRAELVSAALGAGRACLAVGDDDALSLALAETGTRARLAAVDIDERLLSFLSAEARAMGAELYTRRVDVFEDEPPEALLDAFDVVVLDPPRSFDEALAFVAFGTRCLRAHQSSRLFYADHACWNPDLGDVLRAIGGFGLRVARVHRSAARYPLTPSWVPDLPRRAHALGVSEAWLRALIDAVPAHSDLFELAPRADEPPDTDASISRPIR